MLFTFPSQYWFTIGLWGVFSLSGWSRIIHAEFLVLRATQDTATTRIITPYGTFTLYGPAFQPSSGSDTSQISQSYNPNAAETTLVWALPRSLATTCGITIVFSSYGY